MPESEKRRQSFPLRLAPSIRRQANELAEREGISINHFISLAVAEKITRMEESYLQKSVKSRERSPAAPITTIRH